MRIFWAKNHVKRTKIKNSVTSRKNFIPRFWSKIVKSCVFLRTKSLYFFPLHQTVCRQGVGAADTKPCVVVCSSVIVFVFFRWRKEFEPFLANIKRPTHLYIAENKSKNFQVKWHLGTICPRLWSIRQLFWNFDKSSLFFKLCSFAPLQKLQNLILNIFNFSWIF